jgi:hypothetical protein
MSEPEAKKGIRVRYFGGDRRGTITGTITEVLDHDLVKVRWDGDPDVFIYSVAKHLEFVDGDD